MTLLDVLGLGSLMTYGDIDARTCHGLQAVDFQLSPLRLSACKMRIVKPPLTKAFFFDKIQPTVAGSFAANVSRVYTDVNAIKKKRQTT